MKTQVINRTKGIDQPMNNQSGSHQEIVYHPHTRRVTVLELGAGWRIEIEKEINHEEILDPNSTHLGGPGLVLPAPASQLQHARRLSDNWRDSS